MLHSAAEDARSLFDSVQNRHPKEELEGSRSTKTSTSTTLCPDRHSEPNLVVLGGWRIRHGMTALADLPGHIDVATSYSSRGSAERMFDMERRMLDRLKGSYCAHIYNEPKRLSQHQPAKKEKMGRLSSVLG